LPQLFEREICNWQFQLINNHEQGILSQKKTRANESRVFWMQKRPWP